MAARQRSVFFSFWFVVVFFTILGVMLIVVPPYLETWLTTFSWLPIPLPKILSYLLMLLVFGLFLGIFSIVMFAVNRKRGGP
jgi:hypothetical protein